MNLLALDQRYPLATGSVGIGAGMTSWIFAHAADITTIAGMIGAVCTGLLAAIAVITRIASLLIALKHRYALYRRSDDEVLARFGGEPDDLP